MTVCEFFVFVFMATLLCVTHTDLFYGEYVTSVCFYGDVAVRDAVSSLCCDGDICVSVCCNGDSV